MKDDSQLAPTTENALALGWRGAQWSMGGGDYRTLVWYSATPAKPSKAEVDAVVAQLQGAPSEDTLQIISTATPSINAAYRIDPNQAQSISSIAANISATGKFPSGSASRRYADASGTLHIFSTTNFTNFATAVAQYLEAMQDGLAAIRSGSAPIWPTQPVTIP